jgi:tetratricopeptide (TPR) repeat protein
MSAHFIASTIFQGVLLGSVSALAFHFTGMSSFASQTATATAAANTPPNQSSIPTESGLRHKEDAPRIQKELSAEQRADIFVARKMYRAAADSYQESLAELSNQRAEFLRLAAASLREISKESDARAAEAEAKELDKKSAELKEKQQYLPGSGSNFFTRLLAALGLVNQSPKGPENAQAPVAPAAVAAEVTANVEMPVGLSLREQAAFLARNNRHAEAAEIYASLARQIQRKQAVIWNKIGISYHQMLDLPAASRCYRESCKVDPLYGEARNNLGTVLYAQKQYGRAISEYKKALEVNPYSASVHSNMGTAHFARKEYELASVHYAKAVELDPQVFERQGSQGTILQQRTVEDRASFHFYLSKVYARSGDVDRTLLYMRKALEEGFKDRRKFVDDEDFAALQTVPEFQTLLATEFRVL